MTGIPLFDAVFDFVNFIRVIAGIGGFVFGAVLVIGASGFFAGPYSSWGIFVRRYITGDGYSGDRNIMWPCMIGLIICLFVYYGLPSSGAQTLPRFP